LALAPSSLILANNFLPLNEALCLRCESLMKVISFLLFIIVSFSSEYGYACAEKGNKTQIDFAQLETALKMFKLDNGRYPTNVEGLQALLVMPGDETLKNTYRKGGYLAEIPVDQAGNIYIYEVAEVNGKSTAFLKNGASGEVNIP